VEGAGGGEKGYARSTILRLMVDPVKLSRLSSKCLMIDRKVAVSAGWDNDAHSTVESRR
jgi:hypothetical protein